MEPVTSVQPIPEESESEQNQPKQIKKTLPLYMHAVILFGLIYFLVLTFLVIASYLYINGFHTYLSDYLTDFQLSVQNLRLILIVVFFVLIITLSGAILALFKRKIGIILFSAGSLITFSILMISVRFDWINSVLMLIFVALPVLYFLKQKYLKQKY